MEVLRYNMPTRHGDFRALSTSSAIEASYVGPVIDSQNGSCTQGLNRLSVEVHQVNSASTDIVFGAELLSPRDDAPGPTTFQESDEEWIELYNRSAAPVDMTGWSLDNAIDYTFPRAR